MKASLPGFDGQVPAALAQKYPAAATMTLPPWASFPGYTGLDPADPLFGRIGTALTRRLVSEYGSDGWFE
jgi:hypothetical protein